MITSINEFKKFMIREAEDTMVNSDDILGDKQKEERLNAYNSLLKNYNANKNKFLNVIKKDPSVWEKEALKIYQTEINPADKKKYNNKYLVYQWEIIKLQQQLQTYENTIKTKQEQLRIQASTQQSGLTADQQAQNDENLKLVQEEIKKIQDAITQMTKIIADKQKELKTEIQEDQKEVLSLNK